MSEYALPGRSKPYAKILGRIDDCTFTGNCIDQSFRYEKNRNKSDAFRQNRQDGLFDSAVRSFLFLYSVCRCIQSSPRQHPRILPLRSNFLGWSNPLPRELNTSTPKSDFFWQEFSRWYRCREDIVVNEVEQQFLDGPDLAFVVVGKLAQGFAGKVLDDNAV